MSNRVKTAVRSVAHTIEAVASERTEFKRTRGSRQKEKAGRIFWEGEWRSAPNDHHGELRCILEKRADGTRFNG